MSSPPRASAAIPIGASKPQPMPTAATANSNNILAGSASNKSAELNPAPRSVREIARSYQRPPAVPAARAMPSIADPLPLSPHTAFAQQQ